MKMTPEEFTTNNPLIRFSIYTHFQVSAIIELGESIKEEFDTMIQEPNVVDCSSGKDPYGKVWLWVLGTFEIVRTMSDKKWEKCWVKDRRQKLLEYKRRIAHLRVPFAKQEDRNDNSINNENSIYSIDFQRKSYLFRVNDRVFNIRDEIDFFESLIDEIGPEEILRGLRDS